MKTLSKLQTVAEFAWEFLKAFVAEFAWEFLKAFVFLSFVLNLAGVIIWVLCCCP
jgi:hypothetical protein